MHQKSTTGSSAAQSARRGTRRALDNTANKVSTDPRDIRAALREHLRTITDDSRVKGCGDVLGYGHALVQLVRNAEGRARFRGLESCRRVWFCPVCGARISFERAQELARQLATWLRSKRAAWFLTLTFPHDYADPLQLTAKLASKAFTAVLQGDAWKKDRARFDIVGFVRALEVTLGPHGWHPHLHVLVFLKKPRGVRARRALHRRVTGRFAKRIVRAGLRAPDPRKCPLEVVSTSEIGTYVAKASGAAHEMTAWHAKEGRANSRSPFQVLADLARSPTAEDLERWKESRPPPINRKRQLSWPAADQLKLCRHQVLFCWPGPGSMVTRR